CCVRSRLPPASPRSPYTTLFRSVQGQPELPGLLPQLAQFVLVGPHAEEMALEQAFARLPVLRSLVNGRQYLVGPFRFPAHVVERSEEHTSELQSRENLVCRLLLE